MFDELRRLGFVEGQNLTLDWRAYDPRADLVSQFKALCSIQPDVIYTGGPTSIRAAQSATATIPILGLTEDMVGSGLVNSLARPGSNTTGVSMLTAELDGKRLEVLMQAIPSARLIAVLADVSMSSRQQNLAHESEVKLSIHSIAKPEEIVAAIDGAHEGGFIA